jgi:hypothetical protein
MIDCDAWRRRRSDRKNQYHPKTMQRKLRNRELTEGITATVHVQHG